MQMTEQGGTMPAIEAAVVIMLAPRNGSMSRETLEGTALHVEQVLTTYGSHIAPGASASTSFSPAMIEIDATIEATTPTELHQKIGELIEILSERSAFTICDDDGEELVMRSSAAELVPA